MTKLSVRKVLKAIPGTYGVITDIAKACNVSRLAIYNFIDKHPTLRNAITDETERIVDVAERQCVIKAAKGNMKAVELILTHKGKGRGYVKKQEIEHSGGFNQPITVNLIKKTKKEVKEDGKK